MSLWSALGGVYKDAVGAVEDAGRWVEQRIDDAGNWLDTVFHGHPGAQAMPIPEIVKEIQNGYGSTDLHQGAHVANDQTRAQLAISDGSHDLVQRLESAWSGNGADAARENIRPLAVSADDASRTLAANAQHVQTQADTFDRIRNSVLPMPDPAPEANWYDNLVPGASDAEKAVEQYNLQLWQNRQLYDRYHQSSTTVGQSIKIDYGHLPGDQETQISAFQLDPSQQGKDAASGHQTPTGVGGGGSGGYQAPGAAGSYALPVAHSTGGPGGVPGSPRPSVGGYNPSGGGYNPVTTTSGYKPPGNTSNYPQGSSAPGSFGAGGPDPSAGFAGFGPVGGGGFGGGGFGGAGGGESEGRGPGAGSGARGPLAGGNRVGAGEGGYAARPGAVSGAGTAGAAGRAGMSGMSGMGGAAGKGKGEEDEEHETKYLVSEDGDETFGTDQKTAPPVIGL
ncbi:hypothetical protein [Amycolatopsis pigmentata]|uniref:PPE family protein n=1 Tax=Amycolatopsis pigmentata TaxID=450801 RepID=A0ABW5FPU1_9PSEU